MSSIPITADPSCRATGLSSRLKASCAACSLRELCVPGGIPVTQLDQLDDLVATRKRVKRGESLFRIGDPFHSLYAVRTGFFKTRLTSSDGRDQVTGFQMPGELLGLDGVATDLHTIDSVAIQDSEVCIMRYDELERIAREFSPLQHQLLRVMSREIVREHGVMMLLGSMRADERVVAFLLNLSKRFGALGYSPTEFVLRMTREEIGSYLGLKLETVSRAFSKLQSDGLIEVSHRQVKLTELGRLQAVFSDHGA